MGSDENPAPVRPWRQGDRTAFDSEVDPDGRIGVIAALAQRDGRREARVQDRPGVAWRWSEWVPLEKLRRAP